MDFNFDRLFSNLKYLLMQVLACKHHIRKVICSMNMRMEFGSYSHPPLPKKKHSICQYLVSNNAPTILLCFYIWKWSFWIPQPLLQTKKFLAQLYILFNGLVFTYSTYYIVFNSFHVSLEILSRILGLSTNMIDVGLTHTESVVLHKL